MASSETDICAMALNEIGGPAITSVDPPDDSEAARLCNRFYAPTRDAVLRAYPWNFALVRIALAQLVGKPASGFDFWFQLPSDCLRVLENDDTGMAWRIEGRRLLTDNSTVTIRYLSRVTDVLQFDSLFTDALVARLASRLAYPIARTLSLADAMFKLYAARVAEAAAVDGQEGTPPVIENRMLLDVRD